MYASRKFLTVQPRPVNWNEDYSIMYIDNPVRQFPRYANCHWYNLSQVGTGFSFTDSDEGYSRNEKQVADNLYEYVYL